MSHDPMSMSDEATFDLAPGVTPEHRDLGYCNCHPAEKGHDADCGLPQHRAEARRRQRQTTGTTAQQPGQVWFNSDTARAELDELRKAQHDTSAGRKPTPNTTTELINKFREVMPPDLHEPSANPFITGYRQAFLVAANALGVDTGGHTPFVVAFDPALPDAVIDHMRAELTKRVEQLRAVAEQ